MSFDYDSTEVFSHMHLVKEEYPPEAELPKWGFLCDSCGYDSRYTYNGHTAYTTLDIPALAETWYLHLTNSHALEFPKPKCGLEMHKALGLTVNTLPNLYRCVDDKHHKGGHTFKIVEH